MSIRRQFAGDTSWEFIAINLSSSVQALSGEHLKWIKRTTDDESMLCPGQSLSIHHSFTDFICHRIDNKRHNGSIMSLPLCHIVRHDILIPIYQINLSGSRTVRQSHSWHGDDDGDYSGFLS